MIPPLRQAFNSAWTPEKYQAFLSGIDRASGTHVKFRHSETPCFFPRPLIQQMVQAGRELVQQIRGNAEYLERARQEIPPDFDCPRQARQPMFVQADFGITLDASGTPVPKLVEIQGFPSLYLYQPIMAQQYIEHFELDASLPYLLGGLDFESYVEKLYRAIVGDHDPENVILLEIDPLNQKTLPDFLLTEKHLGVRTVDIADIEHQGRSLFYRLDGKRVPIRRIYNRAIADELIRRETRYSFRFSDNLDVEWAGHPNWFFLLSKFSIPYFDHPTVPRTFFLDRDEPLPRDLENWVLKPLYSFAGHGVSVGPSREEVESVPVSQRHNYILQERVEFAPVIETPEGPTKAEVRIMYLWPDGTGPESIEACTTIIRTGRGKMMGVDHNRNLTWVGASAGFVVG